MGLKAKLPVVWLALVLMLNGCASVPMASTQEDKTYRPDNLAKLLDSSGYFITTAFQTQRGKHQL